MESLWLNEKHIEKRLDHKNQRKIATKYHSDHRKHKHDLVTKPNNNEILILEQHQRINQNKIRIQTICHFNKRTTGIRE